MREIQAYEVIEEILKTQDTCSVRDINEYRDKHQYEHNQKEEEQGTHDYVYFCVSREDLYFVMNAYAHAFYWDYKKEIFIRQEVVKCCCCDTEFLKYPDTEKFSRIKEFNYLARSC
ncbi:MAG: hypothetical protein EHM34_09735 [Nitrosopumilales archaeon]|nr:MAG: hypothetical protein EHM34_09735 [Nitrosopumilales archaeon]